MSIQGSHVAEPLSPTKVTVKALFWPRGMLPEPMSVSPVRESEVFRAASTRVTGLACG